MKNLNIVATLFVTLIASTTYAASGAAAVVARAAGKGYSEPTRQEFMKSCLEGVEAPICECVLKKLEAKYDENAFKSLEQALSLGIEDKNYVDFIVYSTTECSALVDGAASAQPDASTPSPLMAPASQIPAEPSPFAQQAGSQFANQPPANQPPPPSVKTSNFGGIQVTDEEIMFLKVMLQSPFMKKTFVQTCSASATEWLGTTQSNKTCSCAYDKLSKDPQVVEKILASGKSDLSDFGGWGFAFIEPCLPKQFPKEMDNAFVKECMKAGNVKKSTCDCVLKTIKKDYNVKSLLKEAFEDSKKLEANLMTKAAQCLAK
ncbi:MAG: hypothetical protein MJY93_09280 [Fibrobacter sp.]|nr:hypothetical protein [Fibrobacter sp.]